MKGSMLVLLALVALASASPVDSLFNRLMKKRTSPPIPGCNKDGVDYKRGDAVPSGDSCNTCVCAGPSVMCTLMLCPSTCERDGNIYYEGQNVPSGDCNTCFCTSGGVACTLMGCIEIPDTCEYNDQFYYEGEDFPAIDGCNNCFCSNGIAACTMMMCPQINDKKKRTSEPQKTCEVDDVIYYSGDEVPSGDCNRCWCMNGGVGCTLMGCDVTLEIKERTSPQKPSCQYNGNTYYQGDTFASTDGCNRCFCSGPAVGCTQLACPQQKRKRTSPPLPYCPYNGDVYVYGDSFLSEDGCNQCYCAGQDLVACTYKECVDVPQKARAVSAKRTSDPPKQCTENGVTYQSGDTINSPDGCNACFCWNGSIGCSLLPCPQED